MENPTFGLVVRGTTKADARVRRARSLDAPSYEMAWTGVAEHNDEMAAGLTNVSCRVLPPVGRRLDGTSSRGYELA